MDLYTAMVIIGVAMFVGGVIAMFLDLPDRDE